MAKTPIKIRFPGFGIKRAVVAYGGHATRFFGLGLTLGKKEKVMRDSQRQLFRMDWKVMGKHFPEMEKC